MTELDEELLPLAGELIDEYGAEIAFGVITPGDYDTETGKSTPVDETKPIKALVESAAVITQPGALIQGALYRLTLAAVHLPREPKPGQDKAVIGGEVLTVLDPVRKVFSGQEVAIYMVQVGK